MAQKIGDIMRTTKLGNGRSIFRSAAHPKIRQPNFGGPRRAEEKVHAGRCTCHDGPSAACPWHLGRFSEMPQPGEEIPRVHGLSNGAWSLFLVIWRGIHNMARKSARDHKLYRYAPGRLRLSRAVGGRNARTRERAADGSFAAIRCWEKGQCDPSTVTAYLRELEACVLIENRLPLIKVVRRCRYEAEIIMQRELLEPTKAAYKAVRPWLIDAETDGKNQPGDVGSRPLSFKESGSRDVWSPDCGTPNRLRSGKMEGEHEVETYNVSGEAELAVSAVGNAPWFRDLAMKVGSPASAMNQVRRMVRRLTGENVPLEDILNAVQALTETWVRGTGMPKSIMGWLFTGARKRWRPKDKLYELEPVAVGAGTVASLGGRDDERRLSGPDPRNPWAVRPLERDGVTPVSSAFEPPSGAPAATSGAGGSDEAPVEETPDDTNVYGTEAWKEEMRALQAKMNEQHAERLKAEAAEREQRRAERAARLGVRKNPWGEGA